MEAWQLKAQQNQIAKSYLVTTDRFSPMEVMGLFPDTPEGCAEATCLAEDMARDTNLREKVLGEDASMFRTCVYRVIGKEIALEDWVDCQDRHAHSPSQVDAAASDPEGGANSSQ
jgi:hypothetical protein